MHTYKRTRWMMRQRAEIYNNIMHLLQFGGKLIYSMLLLHSLKSGPNREKALEASQTILATTQTEEGSPFGIS